MSKKITKLTPTKRKHKKREVFVSRDTDMSHAYFVYLFFATNSESDFYYIYLHVVGSVDSVVLLTRLYSFCGENLVKDLSYSSKVDTCY